jgi:hypothetical protein
MSHLRNTPRAARVFLAAGLLALGYVAYLVANATMYQAIEQRRFESLKGSAAALPELGGSVISEIRIPRLELAAMVVQDDSVSILLSRFRARSLRGPRTTNEN